MSAAKGAFWFCHSENNTCPASVPEKERGFHSTKYFAASCFLLHLSQHNQFTLVAKELLLSLSAKNSGAQQLCIVLRFLQSPCYNVGAHCYCFPCVIWRGAQSKSLFDVRIYFVTHIRTLIWVTDCRLLTLTERPENIWLTQLTYRPMIRSDKNSEKRWQVRVLCLPRCWLILSASHV